MKEASPRYAVTSLRKNYRPGSENIQVLAVPGKSTGWLRRYRLTDKGKAAFTGRQNT
jgi:hypothetical protein